MRAAISRSRTFRPGPTRSRCGRKNSAARRARSRSSRARRSRSTSRWRPGRADPASLPDDGEAKGETMALLKRFDTLEVATADLADAVKAYQQNFGFELKPGSNSERA